MTATLPDVTAKKQAEQSAEQQAAAELIRLAKEQGLSLTGPDGLLQQLTKTVIETALAEEMTEHLGYEKHDPAGAGNGNIRNGTRGTVGDGVAYYGVDHSPTYLWNSATWGISEALIPYLRTVLGGPPAWDQDQTIRKAIEIRDGVVQNPKILSFQGRSADHPHPRM
jgi:hypothetical protein